MNLPKITYMKKYITNILNQQFLLILNTTQIIFFEIKCEKQQQEMYKTEKVPVNPIMHLMRQ